MASDERPAGVSRRRFSLKMTPRSGSIWSAASVSRPAISLRMPSALVDQCRVVARQVELVDRLVEASLALVSGPKAKPARCRNATNSPGARFCEPLKAMCSRKWARPRCARFHQRAGLDQQAQADPVRRRALRQDGVAHAVGQPAPDHGRIMGEHAVRRGRPRWRARAPRAAAASVNQTPTSRQRARGQGMRFSSVRGAPPVRPGAG